ncbi:MAG: hypothetical protein M3Q71_05080 [Chloroflexota bacterium]|nr:hypothetical protein [Chloroflexota bacterium]
MRGGELRFERRGGDLEDALRLEQILEAMPTQIDQGHLGGEASVEVGGGGGGEEDLTAEAGGK